MVVFFCGFKLLFHHSLLAHGSQRQTLPRCRFLWIGNLVITGFNDFLVFVKLDLSFEMFALIVIIIGVVAVVVAVVLWSLSNQIQMFVVGIKVTLAFSNKDIFLQTYFCSSVCLAVADKFEVVKI